MTDIDFSELEASGAFDYHGLVSMIGERGYAMVCDAFYSDFRALYIETAVLVDTYSVDEKRRFAHRIKGSAGNIGAKKLSQLAGEVEGRLRRGEEHSIHGLLVALKGALDTLEAFRLSNPPRSQADD